jgi:hypothetical protein
MKAIILKDRFTVHAVFVRNEVSDDEVQKLQAAAEPYMQEIVVKEVAMVRTLDDMLEEISALNDTGDDNEHK